MNYYNEFDPQAAAWLRELIKRGLIPQGEVDERSIEDVKPGDLRGYRQCHFFAGIGGWAYALELAGWPADRPVWTGSCPCQPFSAAGKGAGFDDQRHLWPAWLHLIRECRPAAVFGEQVASAAVGPWLDLVHADLEGVGYAFGSVAFPAAGVGAPHIRDRTYWVGYANGEGPQGRPLRGAREGAPAAVSSGPFRLADSELNGGRREAAAADHRQPEADRSADQRGGHCRAPVRMGDSNSERAGRDAGAVRSSLASQDGQQRADDAVPSSSIRGMANGQSGGWREECANAGGGSVGDRTQGITAGPEHGGSDHRPGPTNGNWRDADWLGCRDGKWRPVEPGTFPLAHGLPARVGRLRGYGNAIVPQAAAEFICAAEESRLIQEAA